MEESCSSEASEDECEAGNKEEEEIPGQECSHASAFKRLRFKLWMDSCSVSTRSYLSLLLREATSLLSVSLASLASSSSRCSFLRPAATRCASSSASSS